MDAKDATTGAAVAVLLAVLGLIILVGVILVMMFTQSGIEHSPSQASALWVPAVGQLSVDGTLLLPAHEQFAVLGNTSWSQE